MFEKLTEELKKKYGGKKFMELPPGERERLNKDVDSFLDELLEYTGASAMYLYLDRGDTLFQATRGNVGLSTLLSVYNEVQEKLVQRLPSKVVKSLAAAVEQEPTDGVSPSQVARAMEKALNGLPEKYRKEALKNMKFAIAEHLGVDPKEVEDIATESTAEEDDLLDDLLK